MIAEIWYPINYYRLSFGKQDKLGEVVIVLNQILKLATHAPKSDIVRQTVNFLGTMRKIVGIHLFFHNKTILHT